MSCRRKSLKRCECTLGQVVSQKNRRLQAVIEKQLCKQNNKTSSFQFISFFQIQYMQYLYRTNNREDKVSLVGGGLKGGGNFYQFPRVVVD